MTTILLSMLVFAVALVLLAGLILAAERWLCAYDDARIDLGPQRDAVVAPGGTTLVHALAEQGIYLPAACGGTGTCGHCAVTVRDGGGPVLPTERLVLSEDQLAAGVRLACQVKVRGTIAVELDPAHANARRFSAVVSSTLELTPTIRELRLRLTAPKQINLTPGCYVQVWLPEPAGAPVYRAYSVASPVYETGEIALAVQRVPDGRVSGYLHNVCKGDTVTLTGPFGGYDLPDTDAPLVCVAGGCGIAPMKPILYEALRQRPDRRVLLAYGFRGPTWAAYLAQYERLANERPAFELLPVASDGPEDWPGERGMVHEALARRLQPGEATWACVCGPEAMLPPVLAVLREKGVATIVSDGF